MMETVARMRLMNNACGDQTTFRHPTDRCVEQALSRIDARPETATPERAPHLARRHGRGARVVRAASRRGEAGA